MSGTVSMILDQESRLPFCSTCIIKDIIAKSLGGSAC